MATRQEKGRDVFQILKQDHQAVTSLMEEIRIADQQQKSVLCRRLDTQLNRHMDIEEKYVYPVLLDFEEIAELVQDAYTDHDSVKEILEQIAAQDVKSEEWESNFLALEDAKEDHVDMEEDEVFPQAAELLSKDQIDKLTEQVLSEIQKSPEARQPGKPAEKQPRAGR